MEEKIIQAKQIISDSKNIYIIPSEANNIEAVASALALFYTLKEFGKNVNLIADELPERLKFLIPSLDFISLPKNFVISIPNKKADVSQIYYEKSDNDLKIHLTLNGGSIKKDDVSFYFSQAKPDLIITIGIKNFTEQLTKKLNSYGFLMESPILNIDSNLSIGENNNFGKVNLIKDDSLSEIIINLINSIDEILIKKEAAACLLAALITFSENFKSAKITPALFDIASSLIKKGANHQQIIDELYKIKSPLETKFLTQIFKNLNTEENPSAGSGQEKISYAVLDSEDFQDFGQEQARFAIDSIKTSSFSPDNLLVLWKNHSSAQKINGFFYSENKEMINNVLKEPGAELKNNWLFLSFENSDIEEIKNKILNLI